MASHIKGESRLRQLPNTVTNEESGTSLFLVMEVPRAYVRIPGVGKPSLVLFCNFLGSIHILRGTESYDGSF